MIEEAFIFLVVGIFMGAFQAWNKKVFFIAYMLLVIYVLIDYFFISHSIGEFGSVWQTGLDILMLIIGNFSGNIMYHEAFD